jgi:hypothetical protein
MTRLLTILLVVLFASCSLFDKMKRSSFSYPSNTGQQEVRLLVPSGYSRKNTVVDSAGNYEQVYVYPGGALLFVAYAKDTSKRYSPIDTALHLPRTLPNGSLLYKGLSTDWLYWKEIRNGPFRIGYHKVPIEDEGRFDSAVNYSNRLLK